MMAKTKNTKVFYNKEIPNDWDVKHFEDVADIDKESLKGSTPKEYEFDYISLSDVDSDDFKIETTRQVFASAPSRARRIVNQGDILMSTVRPNLQGFSLIRNEVKDLIVSTGFAVITAKDCSNEYLFHYLFSSGIERQFYQLLVGSNYPAINSSDVRKLKIPLPPLPEQKAIAAVLSTWDTAIHKAGQLIVQKEQRKKWLMQNLLTGKKRLKGFEKSTGYHKTDLGLAIPIEWKIVKVKDIFNERKETSKDQSAYPLFSLTIENGLTEKTDRYERSFLLKNKEENLYKLIYPNDILFNPMNLRFGAIAKSKIDSIVSVSAYYNSIFLTEKNADIDYYESLFKTPVFMNLYDRIAIGSLIEKKRVHLSNFLELEIPLPCKEEQTAIAQVLQAADKEISLLKAKADKLREQKKGLMQQLLTGKKRLKQV